jgi:ABC-type multidrug transport system fused ATPase/permease subunit
MDCFAFGTILYFMVGLATTAENYFIFMAIIISFNVLMNELLFVFTTYARTKDTVQVMAACLVFFFILFSGFIISPAVIPSYYNWIYWYNPMAWAYRGVVVNQFRSSEYTQEEADSILFFGGFVDSNGDPFGIEWVGYTFVYLLSHTLISLLASAAILQRVRVRMIAGVTDEQVEHMTEGQPTQPVAEANISFKPVTLSFEDVCYDVKASTGNETLRLLNNIDGAFKSGRLCALMGTSGAGKTTLMDVIALRKTTGTVEGDMRLNGYPQDPVPFRRW